MMYLLLIVQLLQLAVSLVLFFAFGGFALAEKILQRKNDVEDDDGYLELLVKEQGR